MKIQKRWMNAMLSMASLLTWLLVFISLIEHFPIRDFDYQKISQSKEMGSLSRDTMSNLPLSDPFHWVEPNDEIRPVTRILEDNPIHPMQDKPRVQNPIMDKSQKQSIDYHGVITSGTQNTAIIKIGDEWSRVGMHGQGRYWIGEIKSTSLSFGDSTTGEEIIIDTSLPLGIKTLDPNPPSPSLRNATSQ